MRQWIALSLLCMSALLLPVSASAACESPIKFGALTWESGQFISGVLKYIADGAVTKRHPNHRRAVGWTLANYGGCH